MIIFLNGQTETIEVYNLAGIDANPTATIEELDALDDRIVKLAQISSMEEVKRYSSLQRELKNLRKRAMADAKALDEAESGKFTIQ